MINAADLVAAHNAQLEREAAAPEHAATAADVQARPQRTMVLDDGKYYVTATPDNTK